MPIATTIASPSNRLEGRGTKPDHTAFQSGPTTTSWAAKQAVAWIHVADRHQQAGPAQAPEAGPQRGRWHNDAAARLRRAERRGGGARKDGKQPGDHGLDQRNEGA